MEIICPGCGTRYKVSDAVTGKSVRCKVASCRQVFTAVAVSKQLAPTGSLPATCATEIVTAQNFTGSKNLPASAEASNSAKSKAEPDYRSIVEKTIPKFIPQSGIYLVGAIPPKKEQNARKNCLIPQHETLIALFDCTVFGSAKNCLVFTENGIFVHNDWKSKTQGAFKIPYSEFRSRVFDSAGKEEISLDCNQFFNHAMCLVPSNKL